MKTITRINKLNYQIKMYKKYELTTSLSLITLLLKFGVHENMIVINYRNIELL